MAKTKTKFRWQVLVAVELLIIMVGVGLNYYKLKIEPALAIDYKLCGLLSVECPNEVQYYDFQDKMAQIAEYKLSREYIIEVISEVARQEGVDKEMMIWVADCESGLNRDAHNEDDPYGGALSWWQIILHWHPTVTEKCAKDIWCSSRYFAKRVKENQGHLWTCYNLYKAGLYPKK